uniref:Uncharacterized protein n=1 Tax=Meleagris gallopavo TaxID=9103 RepID=A0A803XXG8_MELGA
MRHLCSGRKSGVLLQPRRVSVQITLQAAEVYAGINSLKLKSLLIEKFYKQAENVFFFLISYLKCRLRHNLYFLQEGTQQSGKMDKQ